MTDATLIKAAATSDRAMAEAVRRGIVSTTPQEPVYTPNFESPEYPDDYVSPLTSAGYAARGGFIFHGHEHRAAPTGTNKRVRKPGKMTSMKKDDAPVTRPAATHKPITNNAPISTGFYNMDGDVVRVKLSRSSGKPYGLVLDMETGAWVYTPGVVFKLRADDFITFDQAVRYGKKFEKCMICDRKLTVGESMARGIGPICAAKMGWIDDPSTDAKINSDIVDVTPDPVDAILNQLVGLNDNGTDYAPRDVGLVSMWPRTTASGRLDHTGCTHSRTTAARTACRKTYGV